MHNVFLFCFQQPSGEAPRFKRGLSTVNVELGQPFKLDCQVEPTQQVPNVSWYRNGIELEGPRYMYVNNLYLVYHLVLTLDELNVVTTVKNQDGLVLDIFMFIVAKLCVLQRHSNEFDIH